MARYIYCPLCGLPFSAEFLEIKDPELLPSYAPYAYDGGILSKDQVEWLENFRVMTSYDDKIPLESARLFDGSLSLTVHAWWQQFDIVSFGSNTQEFEVYNPQENKTFRVPVHDVCLEIAHRVVQWRNKLRRPNLATCEPFSLQKIYIKIREAKRSPNMRYEGNVKWPNGYHGVSAQWSQPWTSRTGKEWHVADPLNISDMTDAILAKLQLQRHNPGETRILDTPERIKLLISPLELLPVPAINRLLDYLDLQSIFALRRCSSILYRSLVLTNRFWKQRFLWKETVPWLWDLNVESLHHVELEYDWRNLSKSLAHPEPSDGNLPLGLRNRIRIWNVVREI